MNNKQQEQLLLELAWQSANWNDTLYFQELQSKYKLVIQELINQSGIEEWDIHFGLKDEWVLKILKNTNWCLITVITPIDGIWRNYLSEEWEEIKENIWEILDESGYYTIEDLNELFPELWNKIIVLLENDCTYWERAFDSTTQKIISMLSDLNIKPSQVLIKKHDITLEQCFNNLSNQYFFDCRLG
jgi:hypothetical protein